MNRWCCGGGNREGVGSCRELGRERAQLSCAAVLAFLLLSVYSPNRRGAAAFSVPVLPSPPALQGPSSTISPSGFLSKQYLRSANKKGFWKPWFLIAATSEWPVGCSSYRYFLFTRIRTPRAGTRNCIFNKHSWLVKHLVTQMRETGDFLSGEGHGHAQGHRASFMARPKLTHSFIGLFIHSFIKTFIQH